MNPHAAALALVGLVLEVLLAISKEFPSNSSRARKNLP